MGNWVHLLLAGVLLPLGATDTPFQLDTSLGTVQGRQVLTGAGNIGLTFNGLPYAEPPVGNLRFRPSVLLERPWEGIWNAREFRPDCIQAPFPLEETSEKQSEDCLYLNIDHFASKNIVFVMPAQRLNLFASWTTETADAPGFLWMYDMRTALEWVQRDILHFGGDKDKVTVMGDSSGGMTVSLLTLSPATNKLFNQAIPMSGSGLTGSFFGPSASNMSLILALKAGCASRVEDWNPASLSRIAECMRHIPSRLLVEELTSNPFVYSSPGNLGIPAGHELFPASLYELLDARPPLNLLIGTTAQEFISISEILPNIGKLDGEVMLSQCAGIAHVLFQRPSEQLAKACVEYYASLGGSDTRQMGRLISDALIYLPAIFDAWNNTRNGGRSYIYSFDYVPDGEDPALAPEHSEDLYFVMWHPNIAHHNNYTANDLEAERKYVGLLTDFIKYGAVNGPIVKDQEIPSYLSLDKTFSVKDRFHEDSFRFWYEQAPKMSGEVLSSSDGSSDFIRLALHPLSWRDDKLGQSLEQGVTAQSLSHASGFLVGTGCVALVGLVFAALLAARWNRTSYQRIN